jgi:hypothetical protein
MSRLLNTVSGVFAKLGGLAATATITRTVAGAYDPVTGGPTPGSTTAISTKAVLDGSGTKTLGSRYGEGLVQTGDLEAMIPAAGLTFDPAAGDSLTVGGVAYVVIDARPTYEGATPVLWQLLVRR